MISFYREDFDYISTNNNKTDDEIIEFIDNNAKSDYGLKDKDICELLNMASGSINTLFQRAVRKWLKA